jgi:hypothetical protein
VTLKNVQGDKVEAQIMATVLADYMTNSTLAGTTASSYGFTVSSTGTAARTYNVGSYGSALGLSNNTSYTIQQLLAAANSSTVNGVISTNRRAALGSIFGAINPLGDINGDNNG